MRHGESYCVSCILQGMGTVRHNIAMSHRTPDIQGDTYILIYEKKIILLNNGKLLK